MFGKKLSILIIALTVFVLTASAQNFPIGGRVVFISDRSGAWNLWILDLETRGLRQLTHFPDQTGINFLEYPEWSKDGKRVLFAGRTDRYNAYILDVATETIENITNCQEGFMEVCRWDPNDQNFIYVYHVYGWGSGEYLKYDVNTKNAVRIPLSSDSQERASSGDDGFDITTDGSELLFSRNDHYSFTYFGYQDMEGNLKRLLNIPRQPRTMVSRINRQDDWVIGFRGSSFPGSPPINLEKFDKNAETIVQLTFSAWPIVNSCPCWTSGGNDGWIIFNSNLSGNDEIILMKADGVSYPDGMIKLTDDPASDWFPDWTATTWNNPPIALCKEVSLIADGACLTSISAQFLDAGSSDPDGDNIIFSIDDPGPFPPGVHIVTFTVTDEHGGAASCPAKIIVEDGTPPLPDIPILPTIVGECSAKIVSPPTATDNCFGPVVGTTSNPLEYSRQGTYTVIWTYMDNVGNSSTQTQTVIVKDVTPPTIEVSITPNRLWPPNHQLVQIVPTFIVRDNCDPAPVVKVKSISMNEGDESNTYDPAFDQTTGDGNTVGDIRVDANGNIFLRAERKGNGTGRIYTIIFTAKDSAGNSRDISVTVTVPHDGN